MTKTLLEAAQNALGYLNMEAMRTCDDNPARYRQIEEVRHPLAIAISLELGGVVGGSCQTMDEAAALLKAHQAEE